MGHQAVRDTLDDVLARATDAVNSIDPALAELCRARAAALIGTGVAPEVARPETSLQRACIDLFDQMVLDVTGVTDRLVAVVAAHLGPDATATFVHAALVIEQRLRMHAMWQRLGLDGAV